MVEQVVGLRYVTEGFDESNRKIAQTQRNVDQLSAANKRLETSSKTTSTSVFDQVRGINQYGVVTEVAGKRVNTMGMRLQQAGYQIGDFAVQVQGGTNVAVAFGQQMSQLLGIFGATGAIAGAGVAIVTAFVAPLLEMGREAADIGKQFENLSKAIDSYKSSIDDASMSTSEMNEKFGSFSLQAKGALKAIQDIQMAKLDDSIDAIANSIQGIDVSRINGQMSSLQARLFRDFLSLEGGIKQTNSQVVLFVQALQSLQNANGIASQINSAERLSRVLVDLVGPYEDMNGEQRIFYEGLQNLIKEMSTLVVQSEDALGSAEGLSAATAANNAGLVEAVKNAERLEDELTKAQYQSVMISNLDLESPITLAAIAASNLSSSMKAALASALGLADLSITYNMMEGSAGAARMRRYAGRGTVSDKEPIVGETGESIYKEPRKTRGSGQRVIDINEIIAARQEQIAQERILMGLTGQRRIEEEVYFDLLKQNREANVQLSDQQIRTAAQEIAAAQQINEVMEERRQVQEQLAQTIESSMETAFMSIVDGTKSAKDAFKDMARQIIAELYRVLVVQQLVGAISGGMGSLGSLFSGPAPGSTASILGGAHANGNAFQGGNVIPFANGGVVGSPTTFPMAGGKTGLMGEAGPEAIMPLKRGKDGKLGVVAEGGGGSVVVNNNINVQGDNAAAVRAEVAKLMPTITQATKSAVIDARRRGGQMKAAFG